MAELSELIKGARTNQRSPETSSSSPAVDPNTRVAKNLPVVSLPLTSDIRNTGMVQNPTVAKISPPESVLNRTPVANLALESASPGINDIRNTGLTEGIVQKGLTEQEYMGDRHLAAQPSVAAAPSVINDIRDTDTAGPVVDTKASRLAEGVVDGSAKLGASNVAATHQLDHTTLNSSMQCDFLRKARPEPNTELGRAWIRLGCAGKGGDHDRVECTTMKRKHGVIPGHNWGTLPRPRRKRWTELNCDELVKVDRPRPKIKFDLADACPSRNRSEPLIAVCCGTTTRTNSGWIKHVSPDLSTLALFKHLMPSLGDSLECGFRYTIVVGYDEGDRWWDLRDGARLAAEWFEKFKKTRVRKNIDFNLELTRVSNTVKKPGPVFAAITMRAYELGADFIYRVNDDTELAAPWANKFAQALTALDNIGVVGPSCNQGNRRILTHDFTHRSHMDIFDKTYYPPQLSDWWMDDWISMVYGPARTWRADDVEVVHHTHHHGQRYKVDKSHAFLLEDLVAQGRSAIRSYLTGRRLDASDQTPSPPPSGFSQLSSSRGGNRKRMAIVAKRKRRAQILKEPAQLRQRRANGMAPHLNRQSLDPPAIPPS